MSAYVIVDIAVTDPDVYQQYKEVVSATVKRYGGRYLARGGQTACLEGDWTPGRLVLLEFDTLERAREWWNSAEYREPKALRQRCATTRMIAVEGV
jgi:uncharacterized protein (DUF1330 family)